MFTTTFANSGTNRVDRAITASGVVVYDTTNPQNADLVVTDILDMVSGNKYTFNITGTMDGSQITLSKDNQANSYSTFEEDGTTPAIGTDYNGITKITVDFDGAKCSIVSLDKIVDDISTQVDINTPQIITNTNDITNKLDKIQRAILGGGLLINSSFAINQEEVTGTVVLLAGEYGHDQWRAGAGGCTYTFATSLNITTITISAGTLEQPIDGLNLQSDDYILSWQGTAQGQIDGGGFAVSPVIETIVGGVDSIVEFGTGTLIIPKLEQGIIETDYIFKTFEEELRDSLYYYELINTDLNNSAVASGTYTTTSSVLLTLNYSKKRISPAITAESITTAFITSAGGGSLDVTNFDSFHRSTTSAGIIITTLTTGVVAGQGAIMRLKVENKIRVDSRLT
jgi:hypothetical protein